VADGDLTVRKDGQPVKDVEEVKDLLAQEVRARLHGMARAALMVG
jgi:hypothetical protein